MSLVNINYLWNILFAFNIPNVKNEPQEKKKKQFPPWTMNHSWCINTYPACITLLKVKSCDTCKSIQ